VQMPVQMEWLWYVRADGRPEPMKEVSSTTQFGLEWSATVGASPDPGSFAASREQKVMKAMIAASRSDQTALALEYWGFCGAGSKSPDSGLNRFMESQTLELRPFLATPSDVSGLRAIQL
jgi:hypothetical protein